MPRQVKDHGGISSDEWCTPPEVAHPLHELFEGPVGCDPCSNDRSIIAATIRYTEGGLILPWGMATGRDTAFANWPYSQNGPWAQKAIVELGTQTPHDHNHLSELVVLCMTATSTAWWQDLMTKPARNPRVICTKRLKFLGPRGLPVDSSRFEPALLYYGPRSEVFDRTFAHVAMWSTWGR